MKTVLLFLFILCSLVGFSQTPTGWLKVNLKANYVSIGGDSSLLSPNRDTIVVADRKGELRFRTADSTLYIAKSLTSAHKWYAVGTGTGGSMSTTDNAIVISAPNISLNKTYAALTDAATVSWNVQTGYDKTLTIGGNRTLSISNTQSGDFGTLIITQDGTGGRTLTVPNGIVSLNPIAGSVTVIGFTYNGSTYNWRSSYPFSVDTMWQDGDTIRYTISGTAHAFFNKTTGGSGSVAGNAGDVQINRSSAFATPGGDSLQYTSNNGLLDKGHFWQGNNVNNVKISTVEGGGGATSYANTGGSGDRTASIPTMTQSSGALIVLGGNNINVMINGNTSENLVFFTNGGAVSGEWEKWDFGVGASKVIDEAKFYQSTSDTHGTWKWQGSNDNSSWTDIGANFTLGGSTLQTFTTLSGNTTGYRYYRILGVSGNTNFNPYIREFEFKIADAGGGVTYNYIQTNRTDGATPNGTLALQDTAGLVGIHTHIPDSTLTVNGAVHIRTHLKVDQMDSTASPVNMLYQALDGTIKKAAVPGGGGGSLTVGTSAITSGTANRFLFENGSNVLDESANAVFDKAAGEARFGGIVDKGAYTLQSEGAAYLYNGDVEMNGNSGNTWEVLNYSTYNMTKNTGDFALNFTAAANGAWAHHIIKSGGGGGTNYATTDYFLHGATDQKFYVGMYGNNNYTVLDATNSKNMIVVTPNTGVTQLSQYTSNAASTGTPVNVLSYDASGNILTNSTSVTLTESSATLFYTTTVASGTVAGGQIIVTIEANDGADFQSRTQRFIWTAVNKAGTTTVAIGSVEEQVAVSTGTLTSTITAVDGGSGAVQFKSNAVSSLTQTTLRARVTVVRNY